MWVDVPLENRATMNTVRTKAGEKCALMTVLEPVPVVGFVPLMLRSTILPCVSQPNLFWPAFGWHGGLAVQPALVHLAEWNFSAMYLPIENGKITFGPLRTELTPSFSSAVLFTQPPGPEVPRPIAVRKNDLVPELVCGSWASMGAFLPPTWFQLVTAQL